MPRLGGEADKLGNRYEGLWAVDGALDLIEGDYASVEFEALGDERAGIDFRRITNAGIHEHHSVKRSHHEGEWRLSRLTEKGTTGRSVLGDLIAKTREGDCGFFSSGTSAEDLRELIGRAKSSDTLERFQQHIEGSGRLSGQFRKYIVPIYRTEQAAFAGLQLLTVRTKGEPELEEDVERRVRFLFRMRNGDPIDATAVRLLIADFMTQRVAIPLTAEELLEYLAGHGVQKSQLVGNEAVGKQIQTLTQACIDEVEALLINRAEIVRHESTTVLEALLGDSKHVMLEGSAGSGKSCVLAQVLKQLASKNIPTLAIRLDWLTPNDFTAQEIGTRRGLPDSPAISLGEFAGDETSVLCLDQIDALSLVSGRRQAFWGPFNALLREVRNYPKMRILFACRSFDLDQDSRLRELVEDQDGAKRIGVGKLDDSTILSAIRASGITQTTLSRNQMELLSVALHLYLFIEAARSEPLNFSTAGDLFDAFWDYKARAVDDRAEQPGVFPSAIGSLCDALSQRESLVAPQLILDEFPAASGALASEAVVYVHCRTIRFFHESFFDYAFARTFLRKNSDLVQWLSSDEQHLFRRSQVRQVLAFLRDREPDRFRYLRTLSSLLESKSVRFHIKKVVLDWLGALPNPTSDEWQVIENLTDELDWHAWNVIANSVPWFDVLQEMGRWESWLSRDDEHIDRAIWLIRMTDVLNARSSVVAAMVESFRGGSSKWRDRLRSLVAGGYGYTSSEMQDLVIALISVGTLDEARPMIAINDDWWSIWYAPSIERPKFTARVLAAWFDRQCIRAIELGRNDPFGEETGLVTSSQFSAHVIEECATGAPCAFVRELFPRFASFDLRVPKRWIVAPGMHGKPDDQLREALAKAMRLIAKNNPTELDCIVGKERRSDGKWISALLLQTWSANPDYYAERIVRFLLRCPAQRLDIGYDVSMGETDAIAAVSRTAVAAASAVCSQMSFKQLESAILHFTPSWERDERFVGRTELALLRALAQERIAGTTHRRIQELDRRFPKASERGAARPPAAEHGFQAAGPPIPAEAQLSMSDDHWLSAMAAYAKPRATFRGGRFVGGAVELSRGLTTLVRKEPARFAALANRMDATHTPIYFEAILRGLTAHENEVGRSGTRDQACSVLRRIAHVGVQVPGREIANAIGALAEEDLSDDIVEMLVRVAQDDPDPESDKWQEAGGFGDPVTQAINSARGAAATALARLLFADKGRWTRLKPTIQHLVEDPVLAVRSVAVESLLAILDAHRGDAFGCFERLAEGADAILGYQFVERFLNYAIFRDYPAVRTVLRRMLKSSQPAAARAGARHIALAALWLDEAREDGDSLLGMGEVARVGAASVYAHNLSDKTVGVECEKRLRESFVDESEAVRRAAGECWSALGPDQIASRGPLIAAFAQSMDSGSDLTSLVHRLRNTQQPLPIELCDLAERAVLAYGSKASSIHFKEAGVAHNLSPLMVRLHEETSEPALRKRILDVIDKMVRAGFYGLNEQLRKQYER